MTGSGETIIKDIRSLYTCLVQLDRDDASGRQVPLPFFSPSDRSLGVPSDLPGVRTPVAHSIVSGALSAPTSNLLHRRRTSVRLSHERENATAPTS